MALNLKIGFIKHTIGCKETYPSEDEYNAEFTYIEKLIDTIKALLNDQTGEDFDWPEYHYGEESPYSTVDISINIPGYEALHQLRSFASNLEAIEKKRKIGFGVKILGLLNKENKHLVFDTPASQGLNNQYSQIEAYRSRGTQVQIPVESIFIKGLSDHLLKIYLGEEQTRFPHLIYHADNSGYYLPCLFEKPLWIDATLAGKDNIGLISVGSSLALLDELIELNKYLDINLLEIHDLTTFQQKIAHDELGLVKLTWAILYTMCLNSKKHTLPLLLNE